MLRDTKEIIANYSIIGLVIGVFTMIVRPFISLKQLLRDTTIVFVFTVLTGLLLEHWHDFIAEPVRTGISGVIGFFAVKLYEVITAMLCKIEKDPSILINKDK